ncbi:MAG: right-handed parallel beta-helix repeat-containing protein [Ardenticatenaceae bacterium]|nr:right-handed parallel beta-helix repeat-containing protein [Ardenticatenaceae bacterium]
MQYRFLTFVLFLLFIYSSITGTTMEAADQANCGCDHVHPAGTWKLDGTTLQPGDVVCLGSGTRGGMGIYDVVGSPSQPITIKNCGGQLDIDTTGDSFLIVRSKYLRLTGSGDGGFNYGIRASGPVKAGGLTTNIEIDHIEVYQAGFAGFMVKTDPTCDPATWRENFVMRDVFIHDNYAHGMQDGEGFYIGYTFYDGVEKTCNGQTVTLYGHVIENLHVYNNRSDDTGSEGIQVGSAPGARVFNNVVTRPGQRPFANYQNNGMQINSENISIYNNRIESAPANGLIIFGIGHQAYNNLIIDAGGSGIFADDRKVGPGHMYVNNTIVSPGNHGIQLYMDEATGPTPVRNNIVVDPGSGKYVVKLNGNVDLQESHNLEAATVGEVKFVNAAAGNYELQSTSPAVDQGIDVSALGVIWDMANVSRPRGTAYDIGAYEYAPPLGPLNEKQYVPFVRGS